MKTKGTRKKQRLTYDTDANGARPSKKRRRAEKTVDPNNTGDAETKNSRRRQKPKKPPCSEFFTNSLDSEKMYLHTKKDFVESYSKLLGLEEIFKRALKSGNKQDLESGESSSDTELSDYSISSFEDPSSDVEPFQEVPANSFIACTKVRRKDGTEKVISSKRIRVKMERDPSQ